MFCTNCWKEVGNVRFCPDCGSPTSDMRAVASPQQRKWYQRNGFILLFLILFFPVGLYLMWKYGSWSKAGKIVATVIVGVLMINRISFSNRERLQTTSAQTSVSRSPSNHGAAVTTAPRTPPAQTSTTAEEVILEPVEFELGSGNYTAGIDIPAGKYDIVAVSGKGNVSSTNMFSGGINATMGIDDGSGFFEQEYKNIKLPKNTRLEVSGLVVRISCEKPESGTSERNQEITETIELSNGYFVAGEDFPAGVYDVVAVSGYGNVSSSNLYSGGLNAIMGVDAKFDIYEQEYKNIEFPNDVILEIDGVKINLIPSK